jgi:CO/xanthine dehydrogenase FAD-binding subunit
MNQSKLGSLVEATMNTAIGFVVALLSQIVVFPLVGIHVAFTTNLEIGAWFTLISVVRSYVIRRWFNARLHRAAQSIASRATQGAQP